MWIVSIFHAFKSQLNPQVLDQATGRVLPAYVKLYQNNMLMHLCAQLARPRAGKPSPSAAPPRAAPRSAVPKTPQTPPDVIVEL